MGPLNIGLRMFALTESSAAPILSQSLPPAHRLGTLVLPDGVVVYIEGVEIPGCARIVWRG